MKDKHPESLQSVTWEYWDAIVLIYIVLTICIVIWDVRSYQMVKKWVDSQDPSRSVHLSAEERHLKNEPQLKSTIINALNLCSIGLNAAIKYTS